VIFLILGALLPSLLVAWAFAFVVRRKAGDWGLMDRPGGHKTHVTPTPLGGGLAIYLGVVLPLALGQLVLWLVARGSILPEALPLIAHEHLGGLIEQSP
jgi:UDP-GlcNAc:undecaprenyl-phosphate GlcNAc-1-phosphate transferase